MEDWREEIWERANQCAAEQGRVLIGQLGYGYVGDVFATERQSAFKVLRFERLYQREHTLSGRREAREYDVRGVVSPGLNFRRRESENFAGRQGPSENMSGTHQKRLMHQYTKKTPEYFRTLAAAMQRHCDTVILIRKRPVVSCGNRGAPFGIGVCPSEIAGFQFFVNVAVQPMRKMSGANAH